MGKMLNISESVCKYNAGTKNIFIALLKNENKKRIPRKILKYKMHYIQRTLYNILLPKTDLQSKQRST